MTEPVADLAPARAKELWVVSHEYRLNGNPFTWTESKIQNPKPLTLIRTLKEKIKLGKGPLTLELGFKGCIREHLGRVFPFAGHVWQLSPASHLLSDPQVSPICYLGLSHNNIKNKSNVILLEFQRLLEKRPWSRRKRWRDKMRLAQAAVVNQGCQCYCVASAENETSYGLMCEIERIKKKDKAILWIFNVDINVRKLTKRRTFGYLHCCVPVWESFWAEKLVFWKRKVLTWIKGQWIR